MVCVGGEGGGGGSAALGNLGNPAYNFTQDST